MLFGEDRQPCCDYVFIPRVSSENRKYIPFGFFSKEMIAGDTGLAIPNATLFHFGILTSQIHMGWVRYTCGRLKSDYRYSNEIVYNNFPFPLEVSDKQRKQIETLAGAVLDAREQFPSSSLADLYNPLTMPPVLLKAHEALDKAVDKLYAKEGFKSDAQRVAWLFALHHEITGDQDKKV